MTFTATLFFGLVKDHAFYDGNKRTALLVLLYQLEKYGFFPKRKMKDFERLVLAVADNKLPTMYSSYWEKFDSSEDKEVKTISHIIKKLVVRKDKSYNLNLTMKAFLELLKNASVVCVVNRDKIKLSRTVKRYNGNQIYTYTINFHGYTRAVAVKLARDTVKALRLFDIYPSFESMVDGECNLYKMVSDFEMPLRRLKDK